MKSSTVVFVALLVIVSLVLSTEAVITYRQCKSHDITTGCIFKTFSCTGNYAPSDGAYFTSPVVCCRCNQPGACYGCTSLSCSGSRNTCGAGPSVGGEDVPVIVKKSIGLMVLVIIIPILVLIAIIAGIIACCFGCCVACTRGAYHPDVPNGIPTTVYVSEPEVETLYYGPPQPNMVELQAMPLGHAPVTQQQGAKVYVQLEDDEAQFGGLQQAPGFHQQPNFHNDLQQQHEEFVQKHRAFHNAHHHHHHHF